MTLHFSSFKPLYFLSQVLLLAPVRVSYNPETLHKHYIFHEGQYCVNIFLVILLAIGETFSMYWRFQELESFDLKTNVLNENSDHFMPENMLMYVAFIFSSLTLAVCGVVKTKTNFQRLASLHRILCHVDGQLHRPLKRGKFKYVASGIFCLNLCLLGMDMYAWRFTTSECFLFAAHGVSRSILIMVLVQYEDFTCSIRNRFRCINAELFRELQNYFRRDGRDNFLGRKQGVLPARTLSRRRVGELLQLFWLICRGVQLVNEAYGGLILALLVLTSFHLIVIPHYILINMLNSPGSFQSGFSVCFLCDFLWMIYFTCQLFVLVVPPALASAEGNKTAVIVCKHFHSKTDERFLEELKTFVFRQKLTFLEFVATHVLKLRLPLLTSLMGITTTYLLVSIQMRNAVSDI